MRRWTLPLLLALVCTALAAAPPHPARASGSLGGVPFATGTNGCTGPLVGVYGASALQTYILSEARDYCNAYPPSQRASAPDVEYAAGGDSCPGLGYASSFSDANEVGLSTVFPDSSCANDAQPNLDPSTLVDTVLGVNVVEEIATCPSAGEPNGGAVYPLGTPPCAGFSTDPGTSGPVSCSPAAISLAQAQLLYNQQIGNERSIGGCARFNAVQNRVAGAGDRITWCFNVFGAGIDLCKNEGSAQPLAPTALQMVQDVCDQPSRDGYDAQGYVSRAAVVADPRSPITPSKALMRCGVVTVGGQSGYNGTCDPTNAATQNGANSQAWSSSPTGRICNGDYAVAEGQYQIWGYLHIDLNQAAVSSGANAAAQHFVQFLQSDPDEVQEFGFLETCQMAFSRGYDGGPYVTTTPSC